MLLFQTLLHSRLILPGVRSSIPFCQCQLSPYFVLASDCCCFCFFSERLYICIYHVGCRALQEFHALKFFFALWNFSCLGDKGSLFVRRPFLLNRMLFVCMRIHFHHSFTWEKKDPSREIERSGQWRIVRWVRGLT